MKCQVVLYACVCALIATVSAKKSDKNIKRDLKGAEDELEWYISEQSSDFFEIITGKRFHLVYDFRVVVPSKSTQCYYQEAREETSITTNFMCVNSPTFVSSNKISLTVFEISNSEDVLVSVQNERTGEVEYETKKAGTYAFCLDNSGSSTPATVQISFDIWKTGDIPKYHQAQQDSNNTMYHAFDKLFQIMKDVALIRFAITHTRSTLHYDYSTRMSNLSRVTNFSLLSIVLIVSVCFVQLRVVKKMFSNQRNSV